ncbi:MAG: peptidase S9, partial [Alistipes sp.]
MKKILPFMAIAALALTGCAERPQPLAIDNALTQTEINAGILTPEILWKMTRAGSSSLSPDGATLLYTVSNYNMGENRGVTQIVTQDLASKTVKTLTDTSANNVDPKWSVDGKSIFFLSDRSGTQQLWRMDAAGENAQQLTAFDTDVEGYGISPRGDKAWYVQQVQVCDRKSSDVHKDMDKSKARIYDDLMCRHWDRWDEGSYRHLFVADFDGNKIAAGKDIIGAEAEYDVPLA